MLSLLLLRICIILAHPYRVVYYVCISRVHFCLYYTLVAVPTSPYSFFISGGYYFIFSLLSINNDIRI